MSWAYSIPQPPLPTKVREQLADYADILNDLQDGINEIVAEALDHRHSPPFERVIWRLKDSLSAHCSDADAELDKVKAQGDPEAVRQADKRVMAISLAKHYLLGGGELWDYFQTYQAQGLFRSFKPQGAGR